MVIVDRITLCVNEYAFFLEVEGVRMAPQILNSPNPETFNFSSGASTLSSSRRLGKLGS